MLVAVQLFVTWIVSATGVQTGEVISSTPYDHFASGPYRCWAVSGSRRIDSAGSCPAICIWIVSSRQCSKVPSSPRRSFRCRSTPPRAPLVPLARYCACSSPTVAVWIVSATGVCNTEQPIGTTPDNHFSTSPHCRVSNSASRRVAEFVAVQVSVLGLYLAPVFEQKVGIKEVFTAAPDNHFTASPYCCVAVSTIRRASSRWSKCHQRSRCLPLPLEAYSQCSAS